MLSISLVSASYLMESDSLNQNALSINANAQIGTNAQVSTSTPTPKQISVNEILIACDNVKKFTDENGSLPMKVLIGNENHSISQFLYLISNVIVNKNNNNKDTSISLLNGLDSIDSDSFYAKGNNIAGELNKTTYVTGASSIVNFINSNNIIPNYLISPLDNLSISTVTYKFAEVGLFIKNNNGTLPESIEINATTVESDSKSSTKTSNSKSHSGTSGGSGYSGVTQIAYDLYSWGIYGTNGDCYSFSEWVANKLASAGYSCAIYQGTTSFGNHRAVRVTINGINYWFETLRCVEYQWGDDPDNWATPYSSWNPQGIYKSFNGFNG
jgi:hypothetical protein